MPIFNDDLDSLENHRGPYASPLTSDSLPIGSPPRKYRRLSEESLRTEFCEGPVPDSPPHLPDPITDKGEEATISDRAELIERLKRGESPTWAPKRRLESLYHEENRPRTPARTSMSPKLGSAECLFPALELTPEKQQRPLSAGEQRTQDGLEIERPSSALHRGDFRHEESRERKVAVIPTDQRERIEPQLAHRDTWFATSPPRNFTRFALDRYSHRSGTQSPNLSSSISSSFAYQPPTTPLAQSESNEDLDVMVSSANDDFDLRNRFTTPRRTIPASFEDSPFASPASARFTPLRASLRRGGSLPYQAHQPRRSLTNIPSLPRSVSSPQSPAFLRSRRTSFGGSESSPLHNTSMVGSYEESILRGRMSTTPSKPLDFLAQIGVLGKGDCKPALRCPQHVTLPFPAVYYSYSSTIHSRTGSEDGPSPYVGQVDLENGLPDPEELSRARRRAKAEVRAASDDVEMMDADQRTLSKPSRRSRAARAPPGGSYRIPEKGQVQIIIKNQNKTAVKLFLIPYDLSGMEAGTKTFVRQKSYSAGPILDGIVRSPSNADPLERPILRYLVHLHVCCPSKGRYYLYKSIRIVFANRVPDGKENLLNETTWPEPKFSPYRPIRMMRQPLSAPGPGGAMLTSEKAYRRRSLGVQGPSSSVSFGGYGSGGNAHMHHAARAADGGSVGAAVDPIPLRLPSRHSDLSDSTATMRTPSRPSTMGSATDGSSSANGGSSSSGGERQRQAEGRWEKLKKGDAGYGGNVWRAEGWKGLQEEGLLSRQLQGLGVGRDREGASSGDVDLAPERF